MNIERLLEILKEKHITRYRLAKLSGISESAIADSSMRKTKIQKSARSRQ